MSQIHARLRARAAEIDERLGPISGRDADYTAILFREAADTIDKLMEQNSQMRQTYGSHPLFQEKDIIITEERSLRFGAEKAERTLAELLGKVNHVVSVHGKLDADTPLHIAIREALNGI